MPTFATPENMRRFEAAHPGRKLPDGGHVEPLRCVAWSPITREEWSASSGDYWNLPDDHALCDEAGEPMILVIPTSGYRDAFA